MKRVLTIAVALIVGFMLDGAIVAGIDAESSTYHSSYCAELSAEAVAQIECARNYNSDLKLPTVPSVTAPQYVERTLRNEYGGERRTVGCSLLRAACAGRNYISTKPLSKLFVGKAPSDYGVRMLCRLII